MLYWFELKREGGSARFVPHQIDDRSGVGVQLQIADVNADGANDILTVSKLGSFLFLNRGRSITNPQREQGTEKRANQK